ncbi:MAG: sodium:solute symporter family transporter [Planctomycetota bacterium]
MSWLDFAILFGYLLSTVIHGLWFYKKSDSPDQFMAGGGKIPAWAAGLSVLGTFLSSVTFLTYPGYACLENWNKLVFALTLPFGALFAVYVFIPFYRRMGVISIFSYLERRFNTAARVYGNLCMFLGQVGRAGFSLYLVAAALVTIMRLTDLHWFSAENWILVTILLIGAVVTAYTLLGGIEAVIWTDVVQVVILVGGALLCLLLLTLETPGGLTGLLGHAWSHGKLSLADWNPKTHSSGSVFDLHLASATFLVTFLFGLFENLRNYNFEMVYVQRYATVPSVRAARRSVWLSVAMYIALTVVFLLIGTALNGYYSQSAELHRQIAGLNHEQVFPQYIGGLPPGVRGLLLVAILAAGISTVDSSFNVVATIFFTDIFRRFLQPTPAVAAPAPTSTPAAPATGHEAAVLRLSTYVMGGVSIGFACACINNKSILDLIWGFAGLAGSGLVGLFLLGIFLPRAQARDAWFSILVGTPLVVAFFLWASPPAWLAVLCAQHLPANFLAFLQRWGLERSPLHVSLTLPVGVLLHFGLGAVASLIPHRAPVADAESSSAVAARRAEAHALTIFGFHAAKRAGNDMAPEPE